MVVSTAAAISCKNPRCFNEDQKSTKVRGYLVGKSFISDLLSIIAFDQLFLSSPREFRKPQRLRS